MIAAIRPSIFTGERRSNTTNAPTTVPDSLLAQKGFSRTADLAHAGLVPMANRHGPLIDAAAVLASGTAERDTAIAQVRALPARNGIALRPPAERRK
jgi:hypothetical protein